MKLTLLEMTQEILAAMGSDQINTITETDESYDVALLIRGVYYDILNEIGFTETRRLIELTASTDLTQPTLMTVPATVQHIEWIKYNNQEADETHSHYVDVTYIPFEDFLERQQGLREQTTSVASMTFQLNDEDFEVLYRNDKHPEVFTTVNDTQLLFDSYKATLDTTLQKSKSMAYATMYPTFTLSDSFVPDLDISGFSYLRNKAKARAISEIKQVESSESNREERRQKILLTKNNEKINRGDAVYRHMNRFGRR